MSFRGDSGAAVGWVVIASALACVLAACSHEVEGIPNGAEGTPGDDTPRAASAKSSGHPAPVAIDAGAAGATGPAGPDIHGDAGGDAGAGQTDGAAVGDGAARDGGSDGASDAAPIDAA